MNEIKAIIFDMDGVISDTQTLAANVESKIFKKYGLDIAPEYCTEVYAGTAHRYMYEKEFAKAKITVDINQVIKDTWDILLNAHELVQEIPGSIALITQCKSQGFKLAVASGSIHEFIDMILTTLGIKELFDVIISTTDVKNGKPAPDIFLLAAKKLGVNPSECIVIEDGINGMQAAKAAGMKCIGFVQDKTKKYPADRLISHFNEFTINHLRW